MKKNRLIFFLLSLFLLNNTCQSISIGQRFILKLPTLSNKKQFELWLAKTKPAGIMLMSDHFISKDKTRKVISLLQETAQQIGIPKLLIATDWEGGIVSRPDYSGGFFSPPSPWLLGQNSITDCFSAGMLIGSQLREVGVNMNFAPSLDLFDDQNQILATRCFNADPNHVADYAIAFASGLLAQGITPVVKHFPGLGSGNKDTHLSRLILTYSDEQLEQQMLPFKQALEKKIPTLMSSHAVVRQFGPHPITLSSKAVNYLKSNNPTTLLITDDFSMQAVQEGRTLNDGFMSALDAGYHLIIFSDSMENQINEIERLQKRIDALPENKKHHLLTKEHQIAFFKNNTLKNNIQYPEIDGQAIATRLAQTCLKKPLSLKSIKGKKIEMITVNLAEIRNDASLMIQKKTSYLKGKLLTQHQSIHEHIMSPKSKKSNAQIKKILKRIKANDYIVLQTFFYGDGNHNEIQKEWLEILRSYQKNLIIVSLGHPLEEQYLPDAVCINVGSFNQPLLDCVASLLLE